MKIMIADDHEIVREGLKQLLNDEQDMEVVGEAQDGRETLSKAKSLRPDVLLLDVTMPRLNGLEAIGLIKEALPDVRIVVFSMHKKEAYARQALTAGALGYVLKASPSNEILAAIRQVEHSRGRRLDGERWGPRPLDIDLLLFRDRVIDEPDLQVPHPRCHLRRFVLVPLADLAPQRIHPSTGLSIRQLLAQCPDRSAVELHGRLKAPGPSVRMPSP